MRVVAETPYATVVEVLNGDTIKVDTQGSTVNVRMIGVDTPETVAPDQPIGCYGPEASEFTRETLPGKSLDPAPSGNLLAPVHNLPSPRAPGAGGRCGPAPDLALARLIGTQRMRRSAGPRVRLARQFFPTPPWRTAYR